MAKRSIASDCFECTLTKIYPHKENAKLKRLRRKIYYPILAVWGNYGYCITNGCEDENAKMKMTGFILYYIRETIGGITKLIYIRSGLAPWICKRFGHKLEDCSTAGPDSGNMDHRCMRCGHNWHVTLY